MEQKKHISAKTAAALVTAIRAEYGLPPYHHFDSGHAFFIGLARIKCKNRSFFLREDVLRRAHKRAQKHVALFSSTPPAPQPAADSQPAEDVQPELPLASSSPEVVKNSFRAEWNYAETLALYLRDAFFAVKYNQFETASKILVHVHSLGLLDDSTYDNLSNLLKK